MTPPTSDRTKPPVVPATLYKYYPPERIDIFRDPRVRFSRPADFNDTFDSFHLLPSGSGGNAKEKREDSLKNLGIFCLTETADDLAMWAHYAKDHTGLVIGFNARDSFFADSERFGRVEYCQRPKVFPAPCIEGCFYKSWHWRHEREWRCVKQFEPGDGAESRLLPIPSGLISEIVIGCKMADYHVADLALWLGWPQKLNVKLFRATLSRTQWKLSLVQKSLSFCRQCQGTGYTIEDETERG